MSEPLSAGHVERLANVETEFAKIRISFLTIVGMGVICWGFISWVILHYLVKIDDGLEELSDLSAEVKVLKREIEYLHRGDF